MGGYNIASHTDVLMASSRVLSPRRAGLRNNFRVRARLAGGQLPHGTAAYRPLALIISGAPFYFNQGTPTAPALFVFRGFHYGKIAAIEEENGRTITLYFGNVPNVPLNFGTDNIYG